MSRWKVYKKTRDTIGLRSVRVGRAESADLGGDVSVLPRILFLLATVSVAAQQMAQQRAASLMLL